MKPFSISCTTCQTRLKVRSEQAIGQILSCPKCGSMVLVAPPDTTVFGDDSGSSASTVSSATSSAIVSAPASPAGDPLGSTFDEIDTLLSDEPPVQKPSEPAPVGANPGAAAPSSAAETKVAAAAAAAATRPQKVPGTEKSTGDPASQAAPRAAEKADPRPKTTTKSAAGGEKTAVAPPEPKHAPPVAPAKPVAPAAPPADKGSPKTAGPTTESEAPPVAAQATESSRPAPVTDSATGNPVAPPMPPVADSTADRQPLVPGGDWVSPTTQLWRKWGLLVAAGVTVVLLVFASWRFLSDDSDQVPDDDGRVSKETGTDSKSKETRRSATSSERNEKSTDETTRKTAPSPDEADGTDPTSRVEPERPREIELVGAVDDENSSAVDKTSDQPPPEIAAVDDDGDIPPADGVDDAVVAMTGDDPPADHVPRGPPLESTMIMPPADLPEDPTGGRPEPVPVDVEARLADPVFGLEYSRVSLKDLMHFMSQFSTIPITIDADSLRRAGVTPDRTLEVDEEQSTVGRVLANALGKCELKYQVTKPGHVRIVASDGRLRQLELDLSDLGADEPDTLAALAEMARGVVRHGALQRDGGNGQIQLGENCVVLLLDRANMFRVGELFERLRMARGLPPQSDRSDSLLQRHSRWSGAAGALATPISVNFGEPTPLLKILGRLEDAAGVNILVDWEALAAAHWAWPAETTVSADGLPLSETLDGLLKPMDLAYRVVDATTLQITTPHVVYRQPELEFYPVTGLVSEGYGGDQLVRQLYDALGIVPGGDSTVPGSIWYDEPSEYIVAHVPQPYQRHLERLLLHWQSGE